MSESTCRHCGRPIVQDREGRWIDPEATGDDGVWRETCDGHDTFTAEHEPETGPRPGDLCQLLGNFQVRHYGCDEHPDGTVTDVRTGEVVSRRN